MERYGCIHTHLFAVLSSIPPSQTVQDFPSQEQWCSQRTVSSHVYWCNQGSPPHACLQTDPGDNPSSRLYPVNLGCIKQSPHHQLVLAWLFTFNLFTKIRVSGWVHIPACASDLLTASCTRSDQWMNSGCTEGQVDENKWATHERGKEWVQKGYG